MTVRATAPASMSSNAWLISVSAEPINDYRTFLGVVTSYER
jgi:hypothetical protein